MDAKYEVEVMLPVAVCRGSYLEAELEGGGKGIIERAMRKHLGLPKGGKLGLRFEWEREFGTRIYRMVGYLRERHCAPVQIQKLAKVLVGA